jgi:hypothetical protein
MTDEPRQDRELAALDRVGQFLEEMATVASHVWDRNLKLWTSVSDNMRKEKYGADAIVKDAARTMVTAVDNLDDIWTSLTRMPERERVAKPLPTAFLLFPAQRAEPGENPLFDPVWIRVSPATDDLPDTAAIALTGPGDTTELKSRFKIELVPRRGYRLTTSAEGKKNLDAGVYTGIVYLPGRPARPLANLRVVVEEQVDE